jgi:hypothetical protein
VAVAALSYGAALFAAKLVRPVGPRIEVPSLPLDLGTGKPGEILEGTIPIRNTGDRPLHFEITASCRCSNLEPAKGVVPPRQTLRVRLGVKLESYGRDEHVSLLIRTNDPSRREVTYLVEAHCPAPLVASPPIADFGWVRAGDSARFVVRLLDGAGQPLPRGSKLEVYSSSRYIQARPLYEGNRPSAVVISLLPSTPRGPVNGRIELHLSEPLCRAVVPVSATVAGDVEAVPRTLLFFVAKGSESVLSPSPARERDVLLFCPLGSSLPEVSRVEAPQWLKVALRPQSGKKFRQLKVRLVRRPAELPCSSSIKVYCAGAAGPVTVTVKVMSRADFERLERSF